MTLSATKILHIITHLDIGGAERSLYSLLLGGLASRSDCHVVSLVGRAWYGPKIAALGVPVHTLDMSVGRPSLAGLIKLVRLVRAVCPDIVQGWMYHGNLAATAACALAAPRPALAWNIRHSLHDLAKEKRSSRLAIRGNRLLSKHPKAIVYNSSLSREQHENFGLHATRGRVIPNGFDTTMWCLNQTARERTRRTLGIGERARVVGLVARYHPMKDIPTFLQAMLPLMQRDSDLHCVIVGRDTGPENPALTVDLARLPQDRVHLMGQQAALPGIMPALDILCLSSAWGEGFPNVLGEAMACGVPCVATDVGDSRQVLGETGRIVPPSDPQACSAALAKMLTLTPEERRVLGAQARTRIEECFSLTETVDAYTRLYENLLE